MGSTDYDQLKTVVRMHKAPRFGHSSDLAGMASSNVHERIDYIRGVMALAIMLVVLYGCWFLVLLVFKCMGRDRAGCAAGGYDLEVSQLRKDPHLKPIMRNILRRSWRLQAVFFLTSVLLPVWTALLLKNGVTPLNETLVEIQEINQDIQDVSTRAIQVVDKLNRDYGRIERIADQGLLDFHSFCPPTQNNITNLLLLSQEEDHLSFADTIGIALSQLKDFMNYEVASTENGLAKVDQLTVGVDEMVDSVLGHDWLFRMFVMVLNVVTFALFCGLMLTRQNIIWYPYRFMLEYLLVPVLGLLTLVALTGTAFSSTAAVFNADFCSGGSYPGSPEGTIESIILTHGIQKHHMIYRSFVYYTEDCSTTNPIDTIKPYAEHVRTAVDTINTFVKNVGDIGMDRVSEACGSDITPLVDSVQLLVQSLDSIHVNIQAALQLSDCSVITPILRRIFRGTTCDESVIGLTWVFSSFLGITTFGLILLTVRAALFNPILRSPRRERPDRRQREWLEYKQFMSRYYADALDWKYHPTPEKKSRPPAIIGAESYDTELTAKPSTDAYSDEGTPVMLRRLEEAVYGEEEEEDAMSGISEVIPDGDNDSYPAGIFRSPLPRRRFVQEIEMSERVRDMLHVIDGELEPLSPRPELLHAPKKRLKFLRRTNEDGRLVC